MGLPVLWGGRAIVFSEGANGESFLLPFPASAAAAAKLLQSCPTLCDPTDGSPPGSTVPGILKARTLEWVAISFSNAWEWKMKVKSLSRVRLLATPWTIAHQAPSSMGFSRQEYWSGVPLPSPFPASRGHISWLVVPFPPSSKPALMGKVLLLFSISYIG